MIASDTSGTLAAALIALLPDERPAVAAIARTKTDTFASFWRKGRTWSVGIHEGKLHVYTAGNTVFHRVPFRRAGSWPAEAARLAIEAVDRRLALLDSAVREALDLTPSELAKVADLLESPPAPTAALVAALARP